MRYPPRNDTTTTSDYVVRSVRPSIAYIPSWSISDQSACEWLHKASGEPDAIILHACTDSRRLGEVPTLDTATLKYTLSRCVASIRSNVVSGWWCQTRCLVVAYHVTMTIAFRRSSNYLLKVTKFTAVQLSFPLPIQQHAAERFGPRYREVQQIHKAEACWVM